MNWPRITVLLTAMLASFGASADSVTRTVIGVNDSLAAGSRALMVGNYTEGVRLTLLGLEEETKPFQRARAFSNLCAGYTGLRQHEQALAACDAAIALNANNWRAYNNRSLALIGLGQVQAAWRDFETALALQPGSPSLVRTRAWIETHAPRTVLAAADAATELTE